MASQVTDDANATVSALVEAAASGSQVAWDLLVERYAGLVWKVARRSGLGPADASDVSQTTWLRLVEHLPHLRNAAALPGWLATTARREAQTVSIRNGRQLPVDVEREVQIAVEEPVDADVLAAERREEVRLAFRQLGPRCRDLLALLASDPKPSYREVSDLLGMPIGSIGPNRAGCLDHLRRLLGQPVDA